MCIGQTIFQHALQVRSMAGIFPGGAGDYVVVVAGFGSQTEPRPLRGMAHAAPLGTCAPSQEEVVMRRSASFDIHVNSETVQLAWYVV